MRNLNRQEVKPALSRGVSILLMGLAAATTASCGSERDADDGVLLNGIVLPTDVVLDLACENVGIHPETCVLSDPENPFITTTIPEFDEDNPPEPGDLDKFELADAIPPGPSGAKARFYFWATALVRRPSGENQYYTALALHELFDANSNALSTDEIVREQALKAYRSVLDNFWGSVTFFECELCAPDENGELIKFPRELAALVADNLYRPAATDFRPLIDGGDIRVLETIGIWGYTYLPATPPDFTDGRVLKNEF